MSPRTQTPAPTDTRMWRRLLKAAHPDAGGSDELFVWARELQAQVCGELTGGAETSRRRENSPPEEPRWVHEEGRVPFPVGADFATLTASALELGMASPEPYGSVLMNLSDCTPLPSHERQQQRGASYKQLAAIAHRAGMSKGQRIEWYRFAEAIPLSARHSGHIYMRQGG